MRLIMFKLITMRLNVILYKENMHAPSCYNAAKYENITTSCLNNVRLDGARLICMRLNTVPPFTMVIKRESIYKSYQNAKLVAWCRITRRVY
jgi:hypothetical protein